MPPARDNDHSALALFAAELQAARARAGMSRDELATRINYSPSLVGMVESMRRVPPDGLRPALRRSVSHHRHLRPPARAPPHSPVPLWFRPFAQHEAEATALRTFELVLVPGLLQTPEYARVLLSTRVGTSDEDAEQLVAARMERQAILDRDDPPLLWVVLDEGVLRRPIGDRKVMRAQVEHLVEMADRSSVVIQVISSEVGAHEGVNGSFVIADFANAPSIVYLETALTGLVVERPEDVAAVRLTYDTLRSEAMSRAASLELLQEVANSWT